MAQHSITLEPNHPKNIKKLRFEASIGVQVGEACRHNCSNPIYGLKLCPRANGGHPGKLAERPFEKECIGNEQEKFKWQKKEVEEAPTKVVR